MWYFPSSLAKKLSQKETVKLESKDIDPKELSKALPEETGVYLFSNDEKQVIYIGKAKFIRSRVISYFNSKELRATRIKEEIKSIDFIVTNSEQDALLLEDSLVKKYKPKLNIRLKDDKSFPYIKIDVNEKYPQVYITRNVQNDGARYFGPYASASNVRKTLNLLNKLFPYRSCTKAITRKDPKPCLEFHINRCIAPCSGESSLEEYSAVINQAIAFLEGDTKSTIKGLKKSMWEASESEKFEQATSIRDNINAIQSLFEKQTMITSRNINVDAIDVASNKYETWVDILMVRQGKIKGREHFEMEVQEFHDKRSIISTFLKKFYSNNFNMPSELICSYIPEDLEGLNGFLSSKIGRKSKITKPNRGAKKEILKFLSRNIIQWVQYRERKIEVEMKSADLALDNLQEQLNLSKKPNRIECYDISHIQGTSIVGSMIVFEGGNPKKSEYRKFQIKTSNKNDDFAALEEIFRRRCTKLLEAERKDYPDLLLVDGGKGQLSATHGVLLELGLTDIEIASIAKKREEIFMPNNFESIVLENHSQGKFLLQRIRDEAHRFAIKYHRTKRSAGMLVSALDDVKGIGPKKKKILINHFGSVEKIRNSSVDELYALHGISILDAKQIKDAFN
ncbi:MAG: excinuclease ABC subunit C [Actinobacteria bacterium]|nr:excinuclease ABC subunit C [Actinomycetota bacterium]